MKRLTVFVGIMLVGLLFMQGQARAEGAVQDLTGFWSLHFSSGGTGFLTLVKTGGDGREKPSYTGKLKLEGMGEFPVFGNQAPDYFKPGNEIFSASGIVIPRNSSSLRLPARTQCRAGSPALAGGRCHYCTLQRRCHREPVNATGWQNGRTEKLLCRARLRIVEQIRLLGKDTPTPLILARCGRR